jgi:hypothetical protein
MVATNKVLRGAVNAVAFMVLVFEMYLILEQEESFFFVGMLAMQAEMMWVISMAWLLQYMLSLRGKPEFSKSVDCFSFQTIACYTAVNVAKASCRSCWRWHELPHAAAAETTTALFGIAVCGLMITAPKSDELEGCGLLGQVGATPRSRRHGAR